MRTVAFPTLQGHWTPIAASRRLRPHKPLTCH